MPRSVIMSRGHVVISVMDRTTSQIRKKYPLTLKPLSWEGEEKMQLKLIGRILDVGIIISLAGFLSTFLYAEISSSGLTLRKFAVIWLFIYLFGITLGFRGSIDTHKDGLRRLAIDWIIACLTGILLAAFVLIVT
jgi:hypothetical protein